MRKYIALALLTSIALVVATDTNVKTVGLVSIDRYVVYPSSFEIKNIDGGSIALGSSYDIVLTYSDKELENAELSVPLDYIEVVYGGKIFARLSVTDVIISLSEKVEGKTISRTIDGEFVVDEEEEVVKDVRTSDGKITIPELDILGAIDNFYATDGDDLPRNLDNPSAKFNDLNVNIDLGEGKISFTLSDSEEITVDDETWCIYKEIAIVSGGKEYYPAVEKTGESCEPYSVNIYVDKIEISSAETSKSITITLNSDNPLKAEEGNSFTVSVTIDADVSLGGDTILSIEGSSATVSMNVMSIEVNYPILEFEAAGPIKLPTSLSPLAIELSTSNVTIKNLIIEPISKNSEAKITVSTSSEQYELLLSGDVIFVCPSEDSVTLTYDDNDKVFKSGMLTGYCSKAYAVADSTDLEQIESKIYNELTGVIGVEVMEKEQSIQQYEIPSTMLPALLLFWRRRRNKN